MNTFLSSNKRTQELTLKQFKIRKTAKLCICFICFIQILYRISAILWDSACTPKSILMVEISLPLCFLMIVTISLEYFLFKKKGPRVLKCSNIVDLVLLLLFVGDWVSFLLSSLYKIEQTTPTSFKISSLFGFTAFSWRALLATLLIQKWQLKIIAPITATLVVAGYAVYYSQGNLMFLVFRGAIQLFSIILIVYCQDKVQWRLMRTNLEQEKWMQVNNFILDSIPEKIMILDLAGEAKFMSGYCKAYLKKFNLSVDVKEFFNRVQDLQPRQHYEFDPSNVSITTPKLEKMTTWNEFYGDLNGSRPSFSKVETLQDLITSFPSLMKSKNLQERQFLVYNGKFKTKIHQPEKSIEMRISFVQHYANNYIILILRDMTQRDLLITLEETNKYKDQLLASVSHELRAPLNGNINLVEGALNSPRTPDSIKDTFLTPALRSSRFLLHIINDFIDLSQIKQKKLRLAFQSEDLKVTLKSAAQLVEIQARKKGLDFFVEIEDKIPQDFYTDHLRVSQIVLNLLTNAIKFTQEGTIKLVATLMDGTSSVKISIEDSGIGISQENIKRLFSQNKIRDCEEKERMNPTGAGLGLNVAYNLVQFLAPKDHKTIDVVSTPNQGSTFTFVLENKPLQRKETPAFDDSYEETEELTFVVPPKIFERIHTLNSPCSSTAEIRKLESHAQPFTNLCSCPQVLIVDDNPFNTMALETILHSLKIKCDSVYGGSIALQKLLSRKANPCCEKCKPYSVIFMDQEMPGMSGSETVKEIKKLQEKAQVASEMRIIGCTAHKGKEEVDKFLASGLETCIFKPVSISMIKDILSDL